jgi:transcriptional regulator with GAF, ATPase, and Fis domain
VPLSSPETPAASGSLDFESFVGDLSRTLASAKPAGLGDAIVVGLRGLALHLGVQRAFLGRLRDGLLCSEHFWLHPDLKPEQTEFHRLVDPAGFPVVGRSMAGETVAIHSPEETPESSAERRYMEQIGLLSTLFVPGKVAEEVVGVLVMDSFVEAQTWPDSLVRSLALPVDLLFGALLRLEDAARIRELSGFEQLVGDLSASLAAVKADELEPSIDACLEKLGTHLSAERAFMGRFTGGGDHLVSTNTWAAGGFSPKSQIFDLDLACDVPWVAGHIGRGGTIRAGPGLTGLPEEAEALREQLERDGITSGVVVPVVVEGQAVGMLGLDTLAKPRYYPDPLVERLRVLADVIGSTLVRTRAEEKVQQRLRFEGLLAELSRRCVEVPPEELEREIERWLEPIGRIIDVEHVAMAILSTPDDPASVTFRTWNAGRRVHPLTAEEAPWLVAKTFERGGMMPVCSLADLPPEAAVDRGTLEAVGIRAFVSVPLRCGKEVHGAVNVCSLSRERSWPDDLREWLGLVGEVFANALARRNRERENERLRQRLERENVYLRREIEAERGAHRIVGESPALLQVLDDARRVAETASTVLITGETGTGKELLARLIHETSRRSNRALVKVNCAALPETLVESELFGRERGAYTGAMTSQAGRFEVADSSTIFLDEIGDLPVETQVKLLRVLEEGELERLGSSKTIRVDVRVIAATNRDLEAEVEAGRFREDLYYRLNVFPLAMPLLRERPGDIPLLTWAFVKELASSMDRSIESISRDSMSRLEAYSWPGNVRELRNVLERAMILSRGPMLEVVLPAASNTGARLGSDTNLDAAQRRHIVGVLETTGWRVSGKGGAAELLGMKPTTLYSRMTKLGIRRPA